MSDLTERLQAAISNRYAVERVVGRGGMATVYLARDLKHERPVALKVLQPELSAAVGGDRFLSEIRLTANLQHPNILPLFDSGEADGLLYYVMPFVAGESLRERINREKQLAVDEAVRITTAVAAALEYAHRQDVIHRDIKPGNILLRDEQIFVTDFGIALAVGGVDSSRLTATGLSVGTPHYMSPEQAGGEVLGPASDVYALGAVVYEILTGVPPHTGPNVQAIIAKVFTQEAAPISTVRTGVPPHIDHAVARALAKVAADRFVSVSEFAKALVSPGSPEFGGVAAPSVSCPKCQRQNPVAQGFCGSCGQPLEVPPGTVSGFKGAKPEPTMTDGERRHATVVHFTVEGYATLVEHVDPDELERLTDRIQLAVEAIVGKHGGIVNRAAEEEVIAIFGVPVAHEDDALRAVRAARELEQYVKTVSAELQGTAGSAIGVRTGIGTGFVVARTSRREGERFTLAGDAVQIAARLAVHAGSDQVLVSAETDRLLAPIFTTEPLDGLPVSGRKKAIIPHRVVGESGVQTRIEAAERSGLTQFTGRDSEMHTLQTCLEQSLAGEGQVVSIVGDAGAGKSRLRYEFLHTLDPSAARVIEGRCRSLGQMTPYLPFVEALRNVLSLEQGVEYGVSAVVESVHTIDPGLESFVPLYLSLLSIQSEEYESAQHLRGEDLRLAMLEGLAAVFTLASQQQPLVILLEDWHWADDGSQELLGQLAGTASAYPLLIVITARPQGAPDWKHVDQHTTIRLGPLAESSSVAIMSSILNVDHIGGELGRHLHERTAGNPFFLEELCHAMQEEGVITVATGRAVLTGSVDSLHLPDTVQAVLRTRLDRVDPDAREVLRLASVVGRQFGRETLERALSETIPLAASLETLKSLGMIQQVRVLPKPEYRFKHALTQEAAYESLVQHQRKTLHGLVGDVLEELYPDRAGEEPDVFAHHFSMAEQWPKAVAYGRQAAEKAGNFSQFADAARMLENVYGWIAKFEDSPERRTTEIEVLLAWERACETVGLRDQQRTIIDTLLSQIEPGVHDRELAETYIRQGDLFVLLGRYDEGLEAINTSLEMWRALSDRVGERNALRSLGFLGWHRSDFDSAIAAAKEALAIDREQQDLEAVAQDLNNLGMVLRAAGRIDEALGYIEEAVQLFEHGKVDVATHHALVTSAAIYRDRGDLDKATERLEKVLEVQRRHRLIRQESYTLSGLAAIAQVQGKPEEAIRLYEELVQRARESQYPTGLLQGLNGLSEMFLAQDRPRDALPHISEAAHIFQRMGEVPNQAAARHRLAAIYERELQDYAASMAEWRQARSLCKAIDNREGELVAAEGVARLARKTGSDVETVLTYYADALDLAAELDNDPKQADLLNSLGVVHWQQGDYDASLGCYERALEFFRKLDDPIHVGLTLNSIGAVLRDSGRPEDAFEPLHEALVINRQTGQRQLEGHSLATLGDVHTAVGKPGEALVQYEASLALRRNLEDRNGEGWMLFRIAQVEASQDQWDRALDLSGQARTIAMEIGDATLESACDDLSR